MKTSYGPGDGARLCALATMMVSLLSHAETHCDSTRALLTKHFGEHVALVAVSPPCAISVDLNGDKVTDHAFLVTLTAARETLPKDIHVSNPWSRDPARLPAKGDRAIAVLHAEDANRKTALKLLIGDREALSTPIWDAANAAELISSGRSPKGRGNALKVATEAGIDVALVWNGKRYELLIPSEEP